VDSILIFVENTHSAVLVLVVRRLLFKHVEISVRNARVQFKNNRDFSCIFSPSLPFILSQQKWEVFVFVSTFAEK
jgi:hypothetical protein